MVNRTRTTELVMEAIRRLRIERGFTAREIMHYIESNHDVKALDLRRGVFAALKQGADYGLFKAQRGGRFALRLSPTVPQLVVKRKDESEDIVNERGCAKKRHKSRRRCCTKMWAPKRSRRTRSCKKRHRRQRKSSKRRRKRTRKNRCAKRRRRSKKNRSAKRRRRSRKNRCAKRRSRRHSRRRRAKCRC